LETSSQYLLFVRSPIFTVCSPSLSLLEATSGTFFFSHLLPRQLPPAPHPPPSLPPLFKTTAPVLFFLDVKQISSYLLPRPPRAAVKPLFFPLSPFPGREILFPLAANFAVSVSALCRPCSGRPPPPFFPPPTPGVLTSNTCVPPFFFFFLYTSVVSPVGPTTATPVLSFSPPFSFSSERDLSPFLGNQELPGSLPRFFFVWVCFVFCF